MIDFITKAFSDSGVPSSSRIMSAVCALASIVWISHFVIHWHALPDGGTTTGLAAFSTSHYAAGKISNAIGK